MSTNMILYPPAKQMPSPNHGGKIESIDYLVVHYTAGSNLDSSVAWLRNPAAKASAHLVIGKDGSIVQLIPLDTVAWACGQSAWKGLTGLNKYSISIELDNRGPLLPGGDGRMRGAATGDVVAPENVFHGPHKNGGSFVYWETYTDAQVEALRQAVHEIRLAYPSIKDVIGHDDIAPGRKLDPGPALATVMAELNV